MIASHLAAILAPFAQMANKYAMAETYKCIEVAPDMVIGCAPFGVLEAAISIGIPQKVWLDATTFVAVLKSLPGKEEVSFEIKGGALHWTCGMSDGKLALMRELKMPRITQDILPKTSSWQPTDDFLAALDLGTLSCGSAGTMTAGVYGVLFDNRADFAILSSDNETIASCLVGDKIADFPELITFSPEAVALLQTLIKPAIKEAVMFMSVSALYCVVGAFRLYLRPIAPIKHDLRAQAAAFGAASMTAPIPHDNLTKFLRRASALAESKQRTSITIAVAEGALALSFLEASAGSDEYFLVEGLQCPPLPEIKLDAGRVAKALGYVSDLVLDHVERKVLVFRGTEPTFQYMISGKAD